MEECLVKVPIIFYIHGDNNMYKVTINGKLHGFGLSIVRSKVI